MKHATLLPIRRKAWAPLKSRSIPTLGTPATVSVDAGVSRAQYERQPKPAKRTYAASDEEFSARVNGAPGRSVRRTASCLRVTAPPPIETVEDRVTDDAATPKLHCPEPVPAPPLMVE